MPPPSRTQRHAGFPTRAPAARAGLGAAGYRLRSAETGLAAGALPGRPCAVARRPLPGRRGTAAPPPPPPPRGGRCRGTGGLPGRPRALRGSCTAEPPGCGLANRKAGACERGGSVPSDPQPRAPEAVVPEGPPRAAGVIY